ncbi:hypothetical protein [Verrucomicrobium sp. BvORR034]|uniref:hypothetical protein n=1 Tax=Verrucomicrobium sp. BvORR034 TaxID=1396418 RepID=UPI00067993CB|nr:hypothetical protein [Verrucomicrobium sp. BvORR034]
MKPFRAVLLLHLCSAILTGSGRAADDDSTVAVPLPLPIEAGALIVNEDFSGADAIAKWRLGKGLWTVSGGVLTGLEKPEDKHAAGLACQRKYHDAVIHFRFQFACPGTRSATLLLRNQLGNLCRVIVTPQLLTIQRDRPNLPKDNAEKTQLLGKATVKLQQHTWYDMTAVVKGTEFAVTLHNHDTLRTCLDKNAGGVARHFEAGQGAKRA